MFSFINSFGFKRFANAHLHSKATNHSKRPNQTYNEVIALLSTACPNIFSTTKKHNNHSTLPNQHSFLFNNPIELLLPKKPIKAEPKIQREIEFNGNLNRSLNSSSLEQGNHDDFETESMLDEEIEEGIDSILGNPNSVVEKDNIANGKSCFCFDFDLNFNLNFKVNYNPCFGYPVGVGIGGNLECKFRFGLRNGVRAMKNVDEGDWWSFPAVDVMP
ncbi:hypothetical protein HanLR1_Chr12g0433051 [Helianthus annuus]|nr:hypothetical protein HanLR1_Chr12g0433051 [Helianthus annuus]